MNRELTREATLSFSEDGLSPRNLLLGNDAAKGTELAKVDM